MHLREDPQAAIWRINARYCGAIAVVAALAFGVAEVAATQAGAFRHIAAALARWALGISVGTAIVAGYCELKRRYIRDGSLAHVRFPRSLRYVAWGALLLVALGFGAAVWYTVSRGLVAFR